MTFIQNISQRAVMDGWHFDAGNSGILIQITDPGDSPPRPKCAFAEKHHFEFLDLERDDVVIEPAMKIQQWQAAEISKILRRALTNKQNVIVHCHAGVCRSGAVVEVGAMMGFQDTGVFRSPNLLVKHMLMEELGLSPNYDEPHTHNGTETEFGIIVPNNIG